MSRDFLSEKWDLPTRDYLQLAKKKKKKKKNTTLFCETSLYVLICDYPPPVWGFINVPGLEWVQWGCVLSAMQCHTVTSETFVMLIVRRFWMMIFLMAWCWVIVTVKWEGNWSKKARVGHWVQSFDLLLSWHSK